ncbi:hypothetical protein ACMGGR_00580 [Erwinia sp. BNK-24-b]|uniref:hypothetical protein n=1 Tax=Erwinia TaxID=551 RepID=UPI001FEDD7CA|nr:hypothetical protein [Erwinia phyllosphaerae]MBV4369118.1 hypothetical protein [Erwinia phyllosphaerae]
MYNKIKPDFENYWLDSIEINLKFFRSPQLFFPGKYGVYSRQNEWLQCGRRVDKNLQQEAKRHRLFFQHVAARIQRRIKRIRLLFQRVVKSNFPGDSDRFHTDLYQQQFENITDLLARINCRENRRREKSDITPLHREKVSADETLESALRIILKHRECN